eukprot:1546943-Alexandrium_andersonii.AAC.1
MGTQALEAGGPVHALTTSLCTPGSRGHTELVSFVEGQSLADLPWLSVLAAKLKFTMSSEHQ